MMLTRQRRRQEQQEETTTRTEDNNSNKPMTMTTTTTSCVSVYRRKIIRIPINLVWYDTMKTFLLVTWDIMKCLFVILFGDYIVDPTNLYSFSIHIIILHYVLQLKPKIIVDDYDNDDSNVLSMTTNSYVDTTASEEEEDWSNSTTAVFILYIQRFLAFGMACWFHIRCSRRINSFSSWLRRMLFHIESFSAHFLFSLLGLTLLWAVNAEANLALLFPILGLWFVITTLGFCYDRLLAAN